MKQKDVNLVCESVLVVDIHLLDYPQVWLKNVVFMEDILTKRPLSDFCCRMILVALNW